MNSTQAVDGGFTSHNVRVKTTGVKVTFITQVLFLLFFICFVLYFWGDAFFKIITIFVKFWTKIYYW